MRISILLVLTSMIVLTSCGGKTKSSGEETATVKKDSLATETIVDDSSRQFLQTALSNRFPEWKASFTGFQMDSLLFTQRTDIQNQDYQDTSGMKAFLELYKPSLAYSPDSSQFIDLYSGGIMLEKKGKKIIATGDVDQSVTWCNLATGSWKTIANFGPSAGIEEADWISDHQFVLAGSMHNDDGQPAPIVMIGDTKRKIFSWFESRQTRPSKSTYESSRMKQLNITEWE